jgi:hypothetical protein
MGALTAMAAPPKPPAGLKSAGRAMWAGILTHLALDRHEELLLLEACRVADRLEALDAEIAKRGAVLRNGRPSPALVEARQQQITLARLVVSLRLPEDMTDPVRRPQRRGAVRAAYHRGAGAA